MNNVTGAMPNFSVEAGCLNITQNLQLTDPEFYETQDIDVLIGADWF